MFRSLFDRMAEGAASAVKAGISPLAPYLRMLGTGFLLLTISAFAWAGALFFLSIAIFFRLSLWDIYVAPALWVALIDAILGGILVFFGLKMIRRPRY